MIKCKQLSAKSEDWYMAGEKKLLQRAVKLDKWAIFFLFVCLWLEFENVGVGDLSLFKGGGSLLRPPLSPPLDPTAEKLNLI